MTLCDADKILQELCRAQVFRLKPQFHWLRRGSRSVHGPRDAYARDDEAAETRQVNQTDATVSRPNFCRGGGTRQRAALGFGRVRAVIKKEFLEARRSVRTTNP